MELEYHVVGERFEKEWMNEGKDNQEMGQGGKTLMTGKFEKNTSS